MVAESVFTRQGLLSTHVEYDFVLWDPYTGAATHNLEYDMSDEEQLKEHYNALHEEKDLNFPPVDYDEFVRWLSIPRDVGRTVWG